MDKTKKLTREILGLFEELLDSKSIKIPSKDRVGAENEACLYGEEYYDLEEAVAGVIQEFLADLVLRLIKEVSPAK